MNLQYAQCNDKDNLIIYYTICREDNINNLVTARRPFITPVSYPKKKQCSNAHAAYNTTIKFAP